VSKLKVIVFDHISAESQIRKQIQRIYWRIFDGGYHYLTETEWDKAIDEAGLQIEKKSYIRYFV